MAFNRDKFKALVHYVCWQCNEDPSRLGAVKLNKTLWVADFTAFYGSGTSMTGARYVKRKFGPVPNAILPILQELVQDGEVTISEVGFHGRTKKEFKALTEPNTSEFSRQEIELIDAAIEIVCDEHTAASISKRSHDHIWQSAHDGEEIPYFTIFANPANLTEDDRDWARTELEVLASL